MKINVDDKLKQLENYKFIIDDCISILKEIKQKESLTIIFTLQDAGFGNKFGKLIMKKKNEIIVMKDYPYLNKELKNIKLKYNNYLLFK